MKYVVLYLITVNIIAAAVTVHDKISAKKHRRRVRERTLMLISALGGAPAMYITMLLIRHKTKKPLFMIGIPLVFILELAVLFLVNNYVYRFL